MYIAKYIINAPSDVRIALIADTHSHPHAEVLEAVASVKPDIIAVAGDFICNSYESFLNTLAGIAPTYVSLGNHELQSRKNVCDTVRCSKATLLDNSSVKIGGIVIGGLSSDYDLKWLDSFSEINDFKVLLCHHPEYYGHFIKDRKIDVILSGHAHGGQIRILGRGLYAPGQGIFPKYTSGIYDGRLVVSRGVANTVRVPRLFNRGELVCVELTSNTKTE